MRKYFVFFIIFLLNLVIIAAASAQDITFKDVPEKHWAASYVYDLVKMGVTKGYPDGTFRGTKQITRYETAVFLAKLAEAIGGGADPSVRADIAALKKDIAALKQRRGGGTSGAGLPIAGSYNANWKFGNVLTEAGGVRGAAANYRLQLSASQDMGEGADVTVNLDTMDYGFMDDGTTGTGGVLATELLDIQSNVKLDLALLGVENPVNLKLTYGPGSQQHSADPTGSLPSEVGIVYNRPDTGVEAATSLWGMDVSGGYIAKSHAASGKIMANQLTGTVGYTFADVPVVQRLKVQATGDMISTGQFSSEDRDMRASIGLTAPLSERIEASGSFGLGGSEREQWMVAGELTLNDVWDTGTVANVSFAKVGSDYIDDRFAAELFDAAGLDKFNRPLEEGTVNLGGEVVQTVAKDIKLIGKGDVRLASDYQYDSPKGRFTAEGGISYAIAPNTSLDAMYRLYQDKISNDTSDIAAFGLLYNF